MTLTKGKEKGDIVGKLGCYKLENFRKKIFMHDRISTSVGCEILVEIVLKRFGNILGNN